MNVVRGNLKKSFPNSSESERSTIEKKFYLNLSDVLIESLKLSTISRESLLKRMKLTNPSVFNNLEKRNKGAVLIGAHFNNWEWMSLSLSAQLKQDMYAVYKPLNNKDVDALMLKSRSRFGAKIIPMKQFPKVVLKNKNRATVNLMLADQSPHKSKLDYFVNFLNQDTPVYLGAEKLIKAANLELLFVEVTRVKRGFYEMNIVPLALNKNCEQGEVTKLHLSQLEQMIIKEPQNWLWSHKRWKNSRNK